MTGPEHYEAAERLLAGVTLDATHPDGSPVIRANEPEVIAAAQVHATLALAAATAMGVDMTRANYAGWAEVASADGPVQ